MTVSLRFVGESSIGSKIINWFSAGHLSHVDAVMPNGTLFGSYESKAGGYPTGCYARTPDYITPARIALVTLPCTDEQAALFYGFLQAQTGKAYDWWVIAGFLFGRNWRSKNRWICSELQAAALSEAKILPDNLLLAANKITPMALAFALSALPGVTIQQTGDWPKSVTIGTDSKGARLR